MRPVDIDSILDAALKNRIKDLLCVWRIEAEGMWETTSSLLISGTCKQQRVMLKVVRHQGDEWHCGQVLRAFDGRGVVQVLEHIDGAVLMHMLIPATELKELVADGRDSEATEILAKLIRQMAHPNETLHKFVTVEKWGEAFDRYLQTEEQQLERDLVESGRELFLELSFSQRDRRLLHGDLHHYNILFDEQAGWTAIDPKGVVGELEYEIGASLRNPFELPELLADERVIESRIKCYERELNINTDRTLKWALAQAVLSTIWSLEDGFVITPASPSLKLAQSISRVLGE